MSSQQGYLPPSNYSTDPNLYVSSNTKISVAQQMEIKAYEDQLKSSRFFYLLLALYAMVPLSVLIFIFEVVISTLMPVFLICSLVRMVIVAVLSIMGVVALHKYTLSSSH